MNRLLPVLVGILLLSTGIATIGGDQTSGADVAVTFYPVQSMTTALLEGTGLGTTAIIPSGTDPHSFDPSPSDIQAARSARVYVAAGAGLATWEHEILDGGTDEGPVIVRADSGIELISASKDHTHEDGGHGHQGEGEHTDGGDDISADPHYWISPSNAVTMVGTIRDTLVEQFPEHRSTIEQNHQEYRSELETLQQDYRDGLTGCQKDTILTTHAAYSYIADEYGFEQVTMLGIGPVSEPTPQQIQRLITVAERHALGHVFYEQGLEPDTAETIADEIGASTLSLSPVLGRTGDSYMEAMRMNLGHLRTGLECR